MAEVVPGVGITSRLSKSVLFGAVVAVVLSIGTLSATTSPVTAGKQPIGNVTCDAGGSMSFSPPLTSAGMRGGHEKIVLSETLTSCVGSPGTSGPSSPQSVKTKPIKLPATISGGQRVVGACPALASQFSQVSVKQKIKWGGAFQTAVVVGSGGEEIFTDKFGRLRVHFKWGRSEGGPINVSLALATASGQTLRNCMNGSGSPVASVAVDPTLSSMTEGVTVLTTESVGGTNAAVGDVLSSDVVGGPNCTSASAQASVQFNPAVPGTATLQLTSLNFSNCTIDMGPAVGTLPATVVVNNLPYAMSLGDGPGDPATLGTVSLTMSVIGGSSSCSYASSGALTGGYGNGTNSMPFSGSSLAFTGGTGPLAPSCPTSALGLSTFTSVADSSQSGSPAVFVN